MKRGDRIRHLETSFRGTYCGGLGYESYVLIHLDRDAPGAVQVVRREEIVLTQGDQT